MLPFTRSCPLLRLNLQERMQIETLLNSVISEMRDQPTGYSLRIRNLAIELLLFTARRMLNHQILPSEERSPIETKVTEVVRYINAHFGEPLPLDMISNHFYISKSYLSRVFKEITGFGYSEYVSITRIREAERLLRDTNWSIMQISEHCGFDNFSHFGKMFKKLTGLSP
ncbi:helix-turn-helix protein [Paenibacillus cellulosilyticus]|uniref:Helix-turn-helix protein n=2 Tax=Paenibacillus cellulosilyticus TaxID=375489 RepID=A0A2V2YZQ7_9BACL|nr:helix-turn-helix protein [Paenibacillus cellulosilyticus]